MKRIAWVLVTLTACSLNSDPAGRGPEGPPGADGKDGQDGLDGGPGPQGLPGVSPFAYVDAGVGDIYYGDGNVGIGTTTPNALLEISSEIQDAARMNISQRNTLGGENGGLVWRGYYNGTETLFDAIALKRVNLDDYDGPTNMQRLGLFLRNPTVDGPLIERMSIRENGNVGIGTSVPSARLDVFGPAESAPLLIARADATSDADYVRLSRKGNNDDYSDEFLLSLGFRNGGRASMQAHRSLSGPQAIALNPDGGNVGVGVVDPIVALDVNGAVRLLKYPAMPFTCDAGHDGTIALTSKYTMCACKVSVWVQTTDGSTPCVWQ